MMASIRLISGPDPVCVRRLGQDALHPARLKRGRCSIRAPTPPWLSRSTTTRRPSTPRTSSVHSGGRALV